MDNVKNSLSCAGVFSGWFLLQFIIYAFPGISVSSGLYLAYPVFMFLFLLPYSLFCRYFYQKITGLMPFGSLRLTDLVLPCLALISLSVIYMSMDIPEKWGEHFAELSVLTLFLNIIAIIFIAPVTEEIIFRGFLLNTGIGYGVRGKWAAILGTSLLFSLAHGQYQFPVTFVFIFISSVILCTVRIQTNSLLAPIILHMLYNGSQMFLLFL